MSIALGPAKLRSVGLNGPLGGDHAPSAGPYSVKYRACSRGADDFQQIAGISGSLDISARLSRGDNWPDLPLLKQTAGGVTLFNAEDDVADSIAPRLDLAGADDTRILVVERIALDGKRRPFTLETDMHRLDEVLLQNIGTLFLPVKANLSQDGDGLAYRIVDECVQWETEPVRLHADDALAAETASNDERGNEQREAAEWLRSKLATEPRPAGDLITEEGQQYGFSKRTLQRTFKAIGGQSVKDDFGKGWMWSLLTNPA